MQMAVRIMAVRIMLVRIMVVRIMAVLIITVLSVFELERAHRPHSSRNLTRFETDGKETEICRS